MVRQIRFIGILATSALLTAGGLRVADALPPWLLGTPRGFVVYDTLAEATRDLRTRLLVPAFFPSDLAWPPARIVRAPGEGRPSLVAFTDQRTGAERLLVAQCVDGDCEFPPELLAPLENAPVRRILSGGFEADLAVSTSSAWREVRGERLGRRVIVRFEGDETTLLRMARSLHREGS
ncbi:MAG: hypothetical protein KJ061_08940 [Vicinamibacteraceae bacterium]|nr:hypothetical protein [Vicinamibacteraceae bacterium]